MVYDLAHQCRHKDNIAWCGRTACPVLRQILEQRAAWRTYTTVTPLGPCLDVLPGGPDEILKAKMEETFAGEAVLKEVGTIVAIMTAVQSLWKPLAPNQTRAQLAVSCLENLKIKGLELPLNVLELIKAAAK